MREPPEIYLDHAASAPLLPEAREAVVRVLGFGPGNPSSSHGAGRRLRRELEDARDSVAALVDCRPADVVFTSGTSESNMLGIRGLLRGLDSPHRSLALTAAAHDGVRALAAALGSEGIGAVEHGVDAVGRFDPAEVAAGAGSEGFVVALGLAQSVTGAIQPVREVTRLLDGRAPVHCDAAQAVGRIPVSLAELGVDTLAYSAHKIGGPRGIGALAIREGAPFSSPWGEAAQERGRRAGTEAVALAAGFAAAAVAATDRPRHEVETWRGALAPLRAFVAEDPGGEVITAEPALPSTLLVRFSECPGDALLAALDTRGIRVSTGTACASGARTAPHVLTAGGHSSTEAAQCVRVSVGPGASAADVQRLVDALRAVVPRVRSAAHPTP